MVWPEEIEKNMAKLGDFSVSVLHHSLYHNAARKLRVVADFDDFLC